MAEKLWTKVDAYIDSQLGLADEVLAEALAANRKAGLPKIDVSPSQGALLHILVKMCGARRALEIGTLGGYSSIWIARALPSDGRLVTLEYSPLHGEVARANLARAGLADRVEVRIGKAAELLPQLAVEGAGDFDFVFIDADKPSNPVYLEWALRLSHPGTVIVVDNVIRDGEVADPRAKDENVKGSRAAFDFFAAHPGLVGTAVQTVGVKGYDGFLIGRVS